MKQTKAQNNCVTVLNRLATMCEEDADFAATLVDDLQTMLDEIHYQDGFGTEGQSDPRGVGFALIACFLKAEDAQLVRNHLAIPSIVSPDGSQKQVFPED